jgi:methionyl-tRNA formyltransferase
MRMELGLDTGPVYSRAEIEVADTDTTGVLHDKLASLGAELLSRDILAITSGQLSSVTQSEAGVTYASKIKSSEAQIDWSLAANDIARKIRAFNPHPGAFCHWNDRRLKILKAKPLSEQRDNCQPGTITCANGQQLIVQCGSGSLEIHELQLEGKRRMLSPEFMRGNTVVSGSSLR